MSKYVLYTREKVNTPSTFNDNREKIYTPRTFNDILWYNDMKNGRISLQKKGKFQEKFLIELNGILK